MPSINCDNKYKVYLHRNKGSGEVFYVGIGNSKRPWSFRDRNPFWKNYVAKHGEPVVEVVRTDLNYYAACEVEVCLIRQYGRRKDGGTLTNITAGGESNPMHSADIRKRMSKMMTGRTFSKETRKKMSDAAKRRGPHKNAIAATIRMLLSEDNPMKSPKTRAKMSRILSGKTRTKEACRKNGEVHSKAVDQLSVDGDLIQTFPSQRAAAKSVGCTPANIGMAVSGKIATAKGFTWRRHQM